MTQQVRVEAASAQWRPGGHAFDALALLAVFLAYLAVFAATGNSGLLENAKASLMNLVPLVLLGAAARALVVRHAVGRGPARQIAIHAGLAICFTLLWYWLLMVLIGLARGDSALRFSVEPFFPDPAAAWQLLQGLTFYALIAAVSYLQAQPSLPSFVVAPPAPMEAEKEASPSRYFIRQGEEILPIEVSQIVSIVGADDYAEVTTLGGRHLVRMTLAEFEASLEDSRFIRVHRSRIVNMERILRAEPAGGGRMLLHMESGEIIQASRAGTKLLRERVI
jgi:hypothetical protein